MRAIRADAGDAEISKTGPYIFEVSVPTPKGPLATSAPPATFTPPATFPSPLLSAAFDPFDGGHRLVLDIRTPRATDTWPISFEVATAGSSRNSCAMIPLQGAVTFS